MFWQFTVILDHIGYFRMKSNIIFSLMRISPSVFHERSGNKKSISAINLNRIEKTKKCHCNVPVTKIKCKPKLTNTATLQVHNKHYPQCIQCTRRAENAHEAKAAPALDPQCLTSSSVALCLAQNALSLREETL